MRKYLLILFALQLLIAPSLYAQLAKVVDLKGKVEVKVDATASWQKANPNTYLDKDAEIKTGEGSECTIAFDEELENMLTIKENSYIKIEDLRPGKVFMPRGRVFSLIDNLAKIEKFEIRTPTAIAGVRGTGDSVETGPGGTTVKCYSGKVSVQGVGKNGRLKDVLDLLAGVGIDVSPDGDLGDLFDLSDMDWDEWNAFLGRLTDIIISYGGKGITDKDFLDELSDEEKESLREEVAEELREYIEDKEKEKDPYSYFFELPMLKKIN